MSKGKAPVAGPAQATTTTSTYLEGTDDWSVPREVLDHPFFVNVGSGSMMDALRQLNQRMVDNGQYHLITRKRVRPFLGRTVEPGQIGLYDYNGRPVIAVKPGRYWNFSPMHTWQGVKDITEPVDFRGLTFGQVGQGECMVVMSPSNQIFCIRNGGFAAFGAEGRFKVLATVDTLNLGQNNAVIEPSTKEILGWKLEVKHKIQNVDATVATFFNVPANNVLILQQGEQMMQLEAGQHCVLSPRTTFRSFVSLAERQKTFETKPAYTVEGVPVILRVNLRYRVSDPLLLTKSYADAFAALENPAQSAVNAVVSRMSYQQFMRAKNMSGDVPDVDVVGWLEQFKEHCQSELAIQAKTYGIIIESFTVLDRHLEGSLGRDLEKQAEFVLQNQIKASQIDLENHIKVETQRGQLKVAEVESSRQKAIADAGYYTKTKETDALAYERIELAKAEAESSRLKADQDAANVIVTADAERRRIETIALAKSSEIRAITDAYSSIKGDHTATIVLAQMDVERHRALPQQTVYFTGSSDNSSYSSGYTAALGASMALKKGKVA